MPRIYKSKSSRPYRKYDPLILKTAVHAYTTENKSLSEIANQYNIAKSVLYRHATQKVKCQGGQRCLSDEEEKYITKFINMCSDKGHLMDTNNFRFIIKQYLDTSCKQIKKFTNNLPSEDYVKVFYKRHSKEITEYRKGSRVKISSESTEIIQNYFKNYMNTEKIPTSLSDNVNDGDKKEDCDTAAFSILKEIKHGQTTGTSNITDVKSEEDIDFINSSNSNKILDNKSRKQQIPVEKNKTDMSRMYKSKTPRSYKKYDPLILKIAINAYKTENKPLAEIASRYNIAKSVLYRHATRKMKCPGGQKRLSEEEEEYITKFINICSKRGCVMDIDNFRHIIKQYLDMSCKQKKLFSNNLPSIDYAKAFFNRHIQEIPEEIIKYTKSPKAKITSETNEIIRDYFKEYMNTEKLPDSFPGNDDDVDEAVLFILKEMGYGQGTNTFKNVEAALKTEEDIDCKDNIISKASLVNKSEQQQISIEINRLETKTNNSINNFASLVYGQAHSIKFIENSGNIFIKNPEVVITKQILRLQGSPDFRMTSKIIPVVLEEQILFSKNVPVRSCNDQEEIPISYGKQTDEGDKIVFIVV